MPGITIHLAIAKEYIKKHSNEIKNEKDFLYGIIEPDLKDGLKVEDKSKTHYGKWGNYQTQINLKEFLNDNSVDIELDYYKGYFIHLLTDYYFYNIDFKNEVDEIRNNNDYFYNDYDATNKTLIEKYNLKIPQNLQKYMEFKDKKTKYLKENKLIEFIEKISNIDIKQQIYMINKQEMEGVK